MKVRPPSLSFSLHFLLILFYRLIYVSFSTCFCLSLMSVNFIFAVACVQPCVFLIRFTSIDNQQLRNFVFGLWKERTNVWIRSYGMPALVLLYPYHHSGVAWFTSLRVIVSRFFIFTASFIFSFPLTFRTLWILFTPLRRTYCKITWLSDW